MKSLRIKWCFVVEPQILTTLALFWEESWGTWDLSVFNYIFASFQKDYIAPKGWVMPRHLSCLSRQGIIYLIKWTFQTVCISSKLIDSFKYWSHLFCKWGLAGWPEHRLQEMRDLGTKYCFKKSYFGSGYTMRPFATLFNSPILELFVLRQLRRTYILLQYLQSQTGWSASSGSEYGPSSRSFL